MSDGLRIRFEDTLIRSSETMPVDMRQYRHISKELRPLPESRRLATAKTSKRTTRHTIAHRVLLLGARVRS